MITSFPRTDLARLLALPGRVRLLALLAAFRFLTAPDVARAGIATGDIDAADAAGQLLRLRLQRRLTDQEPTGVLALSRAGARGLAAAIEVDPASVSHSTRSNSARSTMFMDHTLARNSFALMLGAALESDPRTHAVLASSLLSWEHDRDRLSDGVAVLHGPGELRRQALEADGLAVVVGARGVEGLLVEIDRGTEAPGYLGRKFAGYLEWWKIGGPARRFSLPALRVLTVAPDERRVRRLRQACLDATSARASGLFWFAAEEEIQKDGILAPVWSTLRADKLALWS